MIKAPYNFVPLEKTAFYPEWANHISQDIPFEDGVIRTLSEKAIAQMEQLSARIQGGGSGE